MRKKQSKDRAINVRLALEERDELRVAAARLGLPVSTYLRLAGLAFARGGGLEKSKQRGEL